MEAHAIGYVHRDLRPRNIYLAVRRGKANFVKLLDFGLAKLVETDAQAASTSLGMTFGDPRYMSPEQARGDRIDRRADIYQLGCVAYEMLTGAPPFTGNRVFDILTKQVTEIPAPLPTRRPGVPLWMEAAVAKMLAKDPENRFATTTRMVEALRRGLDTGEVMEDEVARRRESIPPPSVSRVMQKLGLDPNEPQPQPRPTPPVAPAPPPAAQKPFDPRATALGHTGNEAPKPAPAAPAFDPRATKLGHDSAPSPAPSAAAPSPSPSPSPAPAAAPLIAPVPIPVPVPPPTMRSTQSGPAGVPAPVPVKRPTQPPPVAAAATDEPRRRTGTPRVGVPVMPPRTAAPSVPPPIAQAAVPSDEPEQVDPNQQPVAGLIDAPPERSDRARKPTNDPSAISQVWYEDEEPDKARKLVSMSTADLYADDDTRGRKSRVLPLALLGAAVVVIGGAVALALGAFGNGSTTPGSTAPPSTNQPLAAAATIDAAPATVIPSDTPDAAVEVAQTGSGSGSAAAANKATTPTTPTAPTQPTHADPVPPLHHPTTTTPTSPTSPGTSGVDDDPSLRRPHLGTDTPTTPAHPAHPGVSGTDGPLDPYNTETHTDDSGAQKAEFYANLGTQQLGNGDITSAAVSFKKASDLDPKNATAAIGLGEIAVRQGLYGDAVAHLNRAAKLAPKNAKIYTLLGEAYLNSGQNKLAADNFKKALQIDPDNARARDGFNEAQSRVPPPSDDQ